MNPSQQCFSNSYKKLTCFRSHFNQLDTQYQFFFTSYDFSILYTKKERQKIKQKQTPLSTKVHTLFRNDFCHFHISIQLENCNPILWNRACKHIRLVIDKFPVHHNHSDSTVDKSFPFLIYRLWCSLHSTGFLVSWIEWKWWKVELKQLLGNYTWYCCSIWRKKICTGSVLSRKLLRKRSWWYSRKFATDPITWEVVFTILIYQLSFYARLTVSQKKK